jgi:hypothetical protein
VGRPKHFAELVVALRYRGNFDSWVAARHLGWMYSRDRWVSGGLSLFSLKLSWQRRDYADGSYFVLAPGGGVNLALGRSRYSVRLVDFEYQWWLNFPFGTLRPYGASTGIAVHFH